ncbi:MAG: HepT-like ribonuclease domain-containing protein [Syntrophotaleaceae bacterium]
MILSERDQVFVEHMLECIGRIAKYTAGDRTNFFQSELVQDAVVRNLQVLAESSQRLSESAKNTQTNIDWRAIAGFRNVLVHDYLGLDLETIWLVIEQDIPQLEKALKIMAAIE